MGAHVSISTSTDDRHVVLCRVLAIRWTSDARPSPGLSTALIRAQRGRRKGCHITPEKVPDSESSLHKYCRVVRLLPCSLRRVCSKPLCTVAAGSPLLLLQLSITGVSSGPRPVTRLWLQGRGPSPGPAFLRIFHLQPRGRPGRSSKARQLHSSTL